MLENAGCGKIANPFHRLQSNYQESFLNFWSTEFAKCAKLSIGCNRLIICLYQWKHALETINFQRVQGLKKKFDYKKWISWKSVKFEINGNKHKWLNHRGKLINLKKSLPLLTLYIQSFGNLVPIHFWCFCQFRAKFDNPLKSGTEAQLFMDSALFSWLRRRRRIPVRYLVNKSNFNIINF